MTGGVTQASLTRAPLPWSEVPVTMVTENFRWETTILTHWGRVTHIGVSNLTIIGSDNGLSPDRRQAIIWTNAGLLFIGPLGTSFNEMLIGILTFSFMKMRLKVSSAKWRPFCLGLNVLKRQWKYSQSCFLAVACILLCNRCWIRVHTKSYITRLPEALRPPKSLGPYALPYFTKYQILVLRF